MVEKVIFILLLLIGLFICSRGIKNSCFYRYACWFFALLLLAKLYSLVHSVFVQKMVYALREAGYSAPQVGWSVSLAASPGMLLEIIAFSLLVFGFYKYSKEYVTTD